MTIKTKKPSLRMLTAAATLTLLSATSAADVRFDYQLEAGAAHTNNINRSASDGADETAGIAGVDLDLNVDTARVNGALALDLERRIYTKDTNDDETLGTMNAEFTIELVDRFLDWQASNSFGQVLVDVFAPDNPLNREDVNVFSTGPQFTVPINATNRLVLGAQYRNVSFEDSPQNNDSIESTLSFAHSVSANREISLNFSNTTLDFDREADPDFDRQSATIMLRSSNSRSSLELELGANRVEFDSAVEDQDAVLIGLDWQRSLTQRLELSVSYNQQLSDAGQQLNLFASARGVGNLVGNVSSDQNAFADPLEQRTGRIALSAERQRGRLFAAINSYDFDFTNSNALDRDGIGLSIGGSRDFTGGWTADIAVDFNDGGFADGREDDNLQVRGSVRKRLSRTLSLDVSIAHIERDSNLALQLFDETSARVTLVWQPGRTRSN